MWHDNKPFQEWRKALNDRGVIFKVLWETKRSPGSKSHDVMFVSFVGSEFSPSESTAILVDYGDGFGVWFESKILGIAKEAEHIATPRQS